MEAACEWAAGHALPVLVLGEGSNMIGGRRAIAGLLVLTKVELTGFTVVSEDADSATVAVGAGEHWDGVVATAVERGGRRGLRRCR